MKVLYILNSCIFGGATISFLNLIKGIKTSNIEVVVVHPKPENGDNVLLDELNKLGCKCIQARVAQSFNSLKPGLKNYLKFIARLFLIPIRKLVFYKELDRIVKKEQPDIIHTNTGVIHEGYLISRRYQIPHVWHLREYQIMFGDYMVYIYPTKSIFKMLLKKSYIFSITEGILNHFNIQKSEKAFVLNEPVMSLSETINNYKKLDYFLVANQINPQKGIDDIIKAYSLFSSNYPNYKLLILGFGSDYYITSLKKLCNELNISSKVEFLGYKKDVLNYMKQAKALIVGSYYEGFGRMTAEANMLGIPVIGRNMSGTKEILELTNGGFLFNTVEQMAEYMKLIASKSDIELQGLMKEPKEKAIKLYSNEQHVQKVLDIYKLIFTKKK